MATGSGGGARKRRRRKSVREGAAGRRRHPRPGDTELPHGIVVLHEDRDMIVVDKPPGLLTMGTEQDKVRTAYSVLTDYVRKGNPKSRHRIFIVHRLDRGTSGILVFAKTEAAKHALQGNWDSTRKTYAAVVHGRCEKASGTITSHLAENAALKVFSTPDVRLGKESHTTYRVVRSNDAFSILEVELLTGRKHQIRVHLADIGHPVVGDPMYGKASDGYRRMGLHAVSLSFNHPFSGKPVSYKTRVPGYFEQFVERGPSTSEDPGVPAP